MQECSHPLDTDLRWISTSDYSGENEVHTYMYAHGYIGRQTGMQAHGLPKTTFINWGLKMCESVRISGLIFFS